MTDIQYFKYLHVVCRVAQLLLGDMDIGDIYPRRRDVVDVHKYSRTACSLVDYNMPQRGTSRATLYRVSSRTPNHVACVLHYIVKS